MGGDQDFSGGTVCGEAVADVGSTTTAVGAADCHLQQQRPSQQQQQAAAAAEQAA